MGRARTRVPLSVTEAPQEGSEIVARLRAGERDAAEALVRQYGPRMLRVASRILGQDDEAQDCVQSAFIKAFRSFADFRGESSIWAWLHRIVANEALLALRARKKRNEEPLDELLPRFDSTGCRIELSWDQYTGENVDALIEQKETRAKVRDTIDRLPDSYRTILMIRDIDGFSTAEAAEALGISKANVKVRLHRARSAFKKLLEPILVKEAQT